MDRTYILCGRRRRTHRHSERRSGAPSMRRGLCFFLAALLVALLFFNLQFYPGVAALALSGAANAAERRIAAAFLSELSNDPALYDDLVGIVYRENGVVSSLSLRTEKLLRARNRLLLSILDGFREDDAVVVRYPLGNLLGEYFSGKGPALSFRILLAEGASAHMESEFASAGINQTLHRVVFSVTLELTVMTPTRMIAKTVCARYPVSETLIVGEVPDAYTKVSRLTDDITEEQIDDRFDFGAEPIE